MRRSRLHSCSRVLTVAEILSERRGAIGTVTLSQPDRLNALTLAMWHSLADEVSSLAADRAVRAIVLRGAGQDAFSAGADISEFPENRATSGDAEAYSTAVARALRAIAQARRPTIAMLHGVCSGGGAGIAAACSLRFADARLRFAIRAARLGVVYEIEAIGPLTHLVGPSVALDILLSGRTVQAEEALRVGLVNAVVSTEALEEHVASYAAQLEANAPISMEAALLAVRATSEAHAAELLAELEGLKSVAIESDDFREGVRAFLEKRQPRFRGE